MNQIQTNSVFNPYAAEVKAAVQRLAQKVQDKPDLEILSDEGKQMLQMLMSKMWLIIYIYSTSFIQSLK